MQIFFYFRWRELMRFHVKTAHAAKRTPNYVELNMIFRKQTNRLPLLLRLRKYASIVVVQCNRAYFLINIYKAISFHLCASPTQLRVFPASRTKNMLIIRTHAILHSEASFIAPYRIWGNNWIYLKMFVKSDNSSRLNGRALCASHRRRYIERRL